MGSNISDLNFLWPLLQFIFIWHRVWTHTLKKRCSRCLELSHPSLRAVNTLNLSCLVDKTSLSSSPPPKCPLVQTHVGAAKAHVYLTCTFLCLFFILLPLAKDLLYETAQICIHTHLAREWLLNPRTAREICATGFYFKRFFLPACCCIWMNWGLSSKYNIREREEVCDVKILWKPLICVNGWEGLCLSLRKEKLAQDAHLLLFLPEDWHWIYVRQFLKDDQRQPLFDQCTFKIAYFTDADEGHLCKINTYYSISS